LDLSRWPHLGLLVEAARGLPPLQVWLFGSALRTCTPADLDVLLIYEDRSTVMALRGMKPWDEFDPPCDIIAMTLLEEREYAFIAGTRAVRLL
jgi:hypothetical protein